jgi:pimeloyl-ACP methyl ester carboxylesterase
LKLSKQMLRALAGILLLLLSLPLSFSSGRRYSEKRYIVDAASCRMNVISLERAGTSPADQPGYVVLFHGISANSLIMQYLARSFAELGLHVYIPDLPGHGRSVGPFSPELAESCSASLLRGLAARGLIVPDRTILAGHSMGGAIALRIADKFRPAGVIAISPAPMQPAHGATPENLLFHGLPKLVPNTRLIVGQFEPAAIIDNAADLAASAHDNSIVFSVAPWNSHVSVLFSPTVARESQAWASRVLALPQTPTPPLPPRTNLLAAVLGILGIILVAGPFIRDVVGKQPQPDLDSAHASPWWRGALEMFVIPMLAVLALRHFTPLRFLHLFEGDYLASFFLLVGVALLLIHFRATRRQLALAKYVTPPPSANPELKPPSTDSTQITPRTTLGLLVGSAIAALLLHFLVTSWFELTATSAWLTLQRWERFPVFFLAAFCFLFAIELLAGPVQRAVTRYIFWFLLVLLAWHALAFSVLHLKSGEILLVLLFPYFALLFLLSGLGIQLVRRLTGSAAAAAIFGAILLAGFCLVLFPVT